MKEKNQKFELNVINENDIKIDVLEILNVIGID